MKKRSRKLQNLSIRVKLVNDGTCIQVVALDHITDTTYIQIVPLFVDDPEQSESKNEETPEEAGDTDEESEVTDND